FCRFRPTKRAHHCGPSSRKFPHDLSAEPPPGTAIVVATLPGLVSNPHWLFRVRWFAHPPELAWCYELAPQVFGFDASCLAGQLTSLESQEKSEKRPLGTKLRMPESYLTFCSRGPPRITSDQCSTHSSKLRAGFLLSKT